MTDTPIEADAPQGPACQLQSFYKLLHSYHCVVKIILESEAFSSQVLTYR